MNMTTVERMFSISTPYGFLITYYWYVQSYYKDFNDVEIKCSKKYLDLREIK